MPTEQETKTIRYAEITAALCLIVVVVVWFIVSPDFASLFALVTALGAVIAVYRRRLPGRQDILIIAVLIVVTGIGLVLIFGRDTCMDYKQGVITCEISDQRAAQLIYGKSVKLSDSGTATPDDELNIFVMMSRPYQDGDVDKFVFLTQRLVTEEDCPDCAPFIDAALFSRIDDAWILDVKQQGIAQVGRFGVSPDSDLEEIGPGKFGYLSFYPGESEGLGFKDVLLITQIGEEFGVVFKELVSLDNFQDCESGTQNECWGYSSSIGFSEGENPGFFDLLMSLDGTVRLDDGTVVPVSEKKLYHFMQGDNKYVEVP